MAKFFGKLGFEILTESRPSTWIPTIQEKTYVGDLTRNYRKLENGDGINDNIDISNDISIVADPYAVSHIHDLRYVLWQGGYWKVSSVSVEFPRIVLSIGGVYNGPRFKPEPESESGTGTNP